MEKKILIKYNKETCIGCGACVSIADDYWDFAGTDSDKVDLLKGKLKEGELFVQEGTLDDEDRLVECQDVCPSESIKVDVEEN